jgi:transcriptional regulator with XRE-family HTH domain
MTKIFFENVASINFLFYLCKLKEKTQKRLYLRLIDKMKDRIRQIMEAQHMTQQVFADFIGTTPATLSGIFNDRTRPTLNIVEMIKKKIPDINTDWLLFGTGQMYLSASAAEPTPQQAGISSVAQNLSNVSMIDFSAAASPTPQTAPSAPTYYNGVRNTLSGFGREDLKIIDKPRRHVTEIRVYYDDQTWESFVPSKK